IRDVLNIEWNKYHRETRYKNAEIIFNSSDLDTILKKFEIAFSPNEEGARTSISELVDGSKTIFYITIVSSLLEFEQTIDRDYKQLHIMIVYSIVSKRNITNKLSDAYTESKEDGTACADLDYGE